MTFDSELRDLAGRAAQAHVSSDGFASLAVKSRVRRARRVYRATVAAGTMAAVVAVGAGAVAVAQRWPEPAPPAVTTVVPTPDATGILPSPTPDVTDAPELITDGVLAGWGDLGVDEGIFGEFFAESAERDGRAVVVGCDQGFDGPSGFGVWYADDASGWVQATAPTVTSDVGVSCVDHVVATPHGFFASGAFGLVRSDDGAGWEVVDLPGYTSGYAVQLFAAGDRVTVFVSRPSLAESLVAEMWTTTDGATWTAVTDGSAAVFDNGGPADVVAFAGRLVAVGASPGGAFVPTAAAWVSSDGLLWERTTPDGEGFRGNQMLAVTEVDGGLTAVGTCSVGQMCAWRSVDGVTWQQEEVPAEGVEASSGSVQPSSMTTVGGDVYAFGFWSSGAATEERVWHRAPAGTWERLSSDVLGAVPLAQVEVGGRLIGFWPGAGSSVGTPVRILTPLP